MNIYPKRYCIKCEYCFYVSQLKGYIQLHKDFYGYFCLNDSCMIDTAVDKEYTKCENINTRNDCKCYKEKQIISIEKMSLLSKIIKWCINTIK